LGVPSKATGDGERNTAWKMVVGALARMGVSAEVEIAIEKRLRVQGGMGAGSANAAAALLGLERELGQALPKAERLRLAAEVGSDVPLFLMGGTVLGLGRGEQVYPLPDLEALACVVAVPVVGVSTGLAFRELDKRMWPVPQGLKPQPPKEDAAGRAEARPLQGRSDDHSGALTFQQGGDRLSELSRALAAVWTTDGAGSGPSGITWATPKAGEGEQMEAGESQQKALQGDLAENPLLALVRTGIENDFEEVVFSQHPFLRSTKRDLLGSSGNPGSDALFAGLSGSGSALFGLYATQAAASEAQQRVQSGGVRAILTETLPRAGYWHTMFAE
jgi:4-diphosphocytidyl-2-C-methyl-D-erythritol kinase